MDPIWSAVLGALGGLAVAIVGPVVQDKLGRSRELDRERRKAKRAAVDKLHDALSAGSLLPYWNELPILAAEIDNAELTEAIGRVQSAPPESETQLNEAGNARRILGRIKSRL